MPALTLRPGTTADIEFIRSLEQRADYAAFIYRWSGERHATTFAEPDKRYLIASDTEGAPCGFAILRDFGGDSTPHLVRMAVANPGQGLGRSFLKLVCDWVFESSAAPAITLDVFEDNARARALYGRLGFQVDYLSDGPVDRPNGEPARLVYMILARATP